jgi:hypothetical protein
MRSERTSTRAGRLKTRTAVNLVPLFEPGSGLFAPPAAVERDTIDSGMNSRMITVRFRGGSARWARAAALNS